MPVLIGPLTFLLLGKTVNEDGFDVIDELYNIAPWLDVEQTEIKLSNFYSLLI